MRRPLRARRRGIMLWALTALMSGGAFGAVTLADARGADAVICTGRGPCAVSVTARTRATTTPAAARAIARPTRTTTTTTSKKTTTTSVGVVTTTTTPPRVAVVAPAPNCGGVVAGVRWPPSWRVVCAGPRSGLLGSTDPSGVTTLFVRAGETMAWLRVVALHESGHAWDLARLDGGGIALWCAARGCDAARFFSGGPSAHEPGGAEDWAASWDACHGGEYDRSYLGLPAPTAVQCALQNELVTYPG